MCLEGETRFFMALLRVQFPLYGEDANMDTAAFLICQVRDDQVFFDCLLLSLLSLIKVFHLALGVLLLHLGHDLLSHKLVELFSIEWHSCLRADLCWAFWPFTEPQ